MITHESYAIGGVPVLCEFLREVDRKLIRSKPSSFWAAVSGFDRIIKRDIWDNVFSRAIDRVCRDELFNGGRDWGVQAFLLCESDGFHFSVRSSKRPEIGRNVVDPVVGASQSIASVMAAPSVLFAVAPGAVSFNVFAMPSLSDLDVFDPNARISSRGCRSYLPWTRIDIDAPRETLELNKESSAHCCIIELAMKPTYSQRWEFDRFTGAPVGAVMLSRESVVLKAMLEEIGRFKYAPAISQVADLVNHGDFNVRWASMKCAFQIDREIGMSLLEKLSLDANPIVRSSADATLNSLRGGCNAT